MCQIGNLSQIGVKIKDIWKHNLVYNGKNTKVFRPKLNKCHFKAGVVSLFSKTPLICLQDHLLFACDHFQVMIWYKYIIALVVYEVFANKNTGNHIEKIKWNHVSSFFSWTPMNLQGLLNMSCRNTYQSPRPPSVRSPSPDANVVSNSPWK